MRAGTLLNRGIFNKTFVKYWNWLAIAFDSYHLKICTWRNCASKRPTKVRYLPYCGVFKWNERGRCYPLRFHSLECSSSKQVFVSCCSSLDIIARLSFKKTVSFHFQSLKWTLTFQWCETLKMEYTSQRSGHLLNNNHARVQMHSDCFTGIYRSILLQNRLRCSVQKRLRAINRFIKQCDP